MSESETKPGDANQRSPVEARYRDYAEQARREREANAPLEGAAWFEATFARRNIELLKPLDDTVNYAIVVQYADPWTVELAAEKYWKAENGYLGIESVTLNTYEPQPENEHEVAAMDRERLLRLYDQQGLEAMMHEAENISVDSRNLNPHRADPRLFRRGPADRFKTVCELAIETQAGDAVQPAPDLEDTQEMASVWLGIDPMPVWQIQVLPVQACDPDGEALGASTVVVHCPLLDGQPDARRAHMLEIGQFHTREDAEHFGQEFLTFYHYAYPGDLPSLAEDVAKRGGLPGTWRDIEDERAADIQRGDYMVTHNREEWQPREYTSDPNFGPDTDLGL